MTTFLIIGAVGLVVLGVSLVLGDLLGGVFDAMTGDVFSSAVLGGFVAAFGFGAALGQGLGAPTVVDLWQRTDAVLLRVVHGGGVE